MEKFSSFDIPFMNLFNSRRSNL